MSFRFLIFIKTEYFNVFFNQEYKLTPGKSKEKKIYLTKNTVIIYFMKEILNEKYVENKY